MIGKNYAAEVSVIADARLGLQALLEEVQRQEVPAALAGGRTAGRGLQAQWLQENAPINATSSPACSVSCLTKPCW